LRKEKERVPPAENWIEEGLEFSGDENLEDEIE